MSSSVVVRREADEMRRMSEMQDIFVYVVNDIEVDSSYLLS